MALFSTIERINYPVVNVIETKNYLILDGCLYDKTTLAMLSSGPIEAGFHNWARTNNLMATSSRFLGGNMSTISPPTNHYNLGHSGFHPYRQLDGTYTSVMSFKDTHSDYEFTVVGDRLILIDTVKLTFKTIPIRNMESAGGHGVGYFISQDETYAYFLMNAANTAVASSGQIYTFVLDKKELTVSNKTTYAIQHANYPADCKIVVDQDDTSVTLVLSAWSTVAVVKFTGAGGTVTHTNIIPQFNAAAPQSASSASIGCTELVQVGNEKGLFFPDGNATTAGIRFDTYSLGSYTKGTPVQLNTLPVSDKVYEYFGLTDIVKNKTPIYKRYYIKGMPGNSYGMICGLYPLLPDGRKLYAKYMDNVSNTYVGANIVFTTEDPGYTNTTYPPIPAGYELGPDEVLVYGEVITRYSGTAGDMRNVFTTDTMTSGLGSYFGLLGSSGGGANIILDIVKRGKNFTSNFKGFEVGTMNAKGAVGTVGNYYSGSVQLYCYTEKSHYNISGGYHANTTITVPTPAAVVRGQLTTVLLADTTAKTKEEFLKLHLWDNGINYNRAAVSSVGNFGTFAHIMGENNEFMVIANHWNHNGSTVRNNEFIAIYKRNSLDDPYDLTLVDFKWCKDLYANMGYGNYMFKIDNSWILYPRDRFLIRITLSPEGHIQTTRINRDYVTMIGIDAKKRVYLKTNGTNTPEVLFFDSPFAVSLSYLDPHNDSYDTYKGQPIIKTVLVKVTNSLGEPCKGTVELRTTSTSAVFAATSSQYYRLNVPESGEARVQVRINKPAEFNITGSVLITSDLAIIQGKN